METRSNVCNVDGCSEPVHVNRARDGGDPLWQRSKCRRHLREQWLTERERRRARDESLPASERKCPWTDCSETREPGEAYCVRHLKTRRQSYQATRAARESRIPVAERKLCIEDCSEPRIPGDPRCLEHRREANRARRRLRRERQLAANGGIVKPRRTTRTLWSPDTTWRIEVSS